MLEAWTKHVDYAKDGLGITAMDPDGHGLHIMAPLPEVTALKSSRRYRWEMLTAHLCAGYRLRRAMKARSSESEPGELSLGADAVIDPKRFEIADAVGHAAKRTHADALRATAISIDRARGSLRKDDPTEALETWTALVEGRWSIVDWFDSDDRRYVLAIPNAPHVSDPRGLTDREKQVVAYAALGDNHKLIAYRLGLSRSRVTKALGSAMRKLGVSTQAALVAKLRGVSSLTSPDQQ
jgi:DNA-binding CsgD family transcriptional regulator